MCNLFHEENIINDYVSYNFHSQCTLLQSEWIKNGGVTRLQANVDDVNEDKVAKLYIENIAIEEICHAVQHWLPFL